MNFSAVPHGQPLYVATNFFQFLLGLFLRKSVCKISRFNLVFLLAAPLLNSRVVWDGKGSNLFNIVKLLFKLFSFVFLSLKLFKLRSILLTFNSSNQPSLYPFHCFPSSEAGCKSRKIFYPRKTIVAYICINTLTC